MAAPDLKTNFQNQLKEIDEKITQIQEELVKAKEYKLKLVGGLETLELLEQQAEGETPDDLGALPETTEE
tara:strand:+ start:1332 stop:1541 length:210 start_codon:yes stop_codon:yes gene_type:complete